MIDCYFDSFTYKKKFFLSAESHKFETPSPDTHIPLKYISKTLFLAHFSL
jgi:hypothetical protein